MIFLIDTDIAVYAINDVRGLKAAFRSTDASSLMTSALVYSQLLQGIDSQPDPAIERLLIDSFMLALIVVPYDEAAAVRYGEIVAAKGYNRRHTLDRMIAAHAISLDATLVTNNTADFADIDGLRLENWAA